MTRRTAADAPDLPAASYTLRSVQAMLGLSRGVVAALVEAGFVTPTRGRRNEWRFTFRDLMLLRTAHALRQSRIPPRRILRSLARLKASLPAELPLSGLRITAIGPEVAVRSRDGRWQADSGQLLMDFDVAPAAGSVAFLERTTAAAGAEPADADAWFERGRAAESRDAAAAEAAYRRAIALDAAHEAAYVNLSALLAEQGRWDEMAVVSAAAQRHCPDCALAHYNRGVALDHLERLDEAQAAYERALALDATLADAHYNLGRLREQLGDERGALRHFSAYRRLQR